MHYLISIDGTPSNIILADDQAIADHIASLNGGTARLLADGERVEFPEPEFIPQPAQSISRNQAKIVLANHGLLDIAEQVVAEMDQTAQIAWNDAPEYHRNSQTLLAVANALGLSAEAVDALFAEALAITV